MSNISKRVFRNRKIALEQLESRQLMVLDLANIVSSFNYGMLTLRAKSDDIAIEALSRDVAQNTPLIKEESLAADLKAPEYLRQLFRGSMSNLSSIDMVIQDLVDQGFVVQRLSTESDASGDYVRLVRDYSQQSSILIPAKDFEGLPYFQNGFGSIAGNLTGSVQNYSGHITVGLDQSGFYFDSRSIISASGIVAIGNVTSNYDIGHLNDVAISGTGKIIANAGITFSDPDNDGKLRISQLSDPAVVRGNFSGTVSLENAVFNGNIPNVTDFGWTGTFVGRLSSNRVTARETLVEPSYNSLMRSMKLGFVEGLRNLDWVQKLNQYIDVRIPYLDKSIGELLKTEEIVDKALSKVGFIVLPKSQQQAAMQKLIRGHNVDLVSYDKEFSVELGEWNVISPIKIVDYKFFGGIVSADLSASVTADLGLDAHIHVGIGTRGFWVDETTSLTLSGSIWGNLNGRVQLLNFDVVSAKGSLGITTGAKLSISSPIPGESKVYLSELGNSPSEIANRALEMMSLDFKVSLEGKAQAKALFGLIKWKRKANFADIVDIHVGPESGSKIQFRRSRAFVEAIDRSVEAENIELVQAGPGMESSVQSKSFQSNQYGNSAQLLLKSQGDSWIELSLNSETADQRLLHLAVTKNSHQSAFKVSWNGRVLNERIDQFENFDNDIVESHNLGAVDVVFGTNVLRIDLLNGNSPYDEVFRELGIDGIDFFDAGVFEQGPGSISGLIVDNLWPTTVDLRWNSISTANHYLIEKRNGEQWDVVGNTPGARPVIRIASLAPATLYTFRVTSLNSLGRGTPASIEVRTKEVIPAAPSNLRIDNVWARTIDLRWDDRSNNESEFRIAISTDGTNWNNAGTTAANATSFRVENLQPVTRYWFKVRAANSEGFSEYTNTVEIVTRDIPPATPSNLRIDNVWARTIDLRWDDRSNNESEFRIAISTDGTNWNNAGTTAANATSFRVENLQPVTRYWFKVRAANSEGFSEYTNTVEVVTRDIPPASPSNLRVDNLWARTIDLRWDDRSNNESEFRIAISTDGTNWNSAGTTGANATSFRVENLQPVTRYWFKVRASNAEGFSEYANTVEVVTRDIPPATPSNLRIDNVWARTIDLRWDDHSNNESEFRIAISTDGTNWNSVGTTGANATSFRVENLQPVTRYWFKVRASNTEGFSEYTNTVEVVTRDVPPATPSNLRIDNVWARTIDLRWDDSSNNESEFRIAISTDGANWNNAGTTGANATSFRVENLQPATRYWFKVRAANSEGFSEYTNTIEVVTRDVPPASPSNLKLDNVWATQLDLSWNDNSSNESGFRIEISTNGSSWQVAKDVESNRTSTRISGLISNRLYYFRVVAFNSVGWSSYSNVLSVRTR